MKCFVSFLVVIILIFLVSLCLADIPKLINYQGMLTNSSGDPLTGFYNLTFYIYDDTTGGTLEWSEIQNGVQVQNGLFNVVLGKQNALNIPFNESYWLAVKVGTETMPRVRFTSVGYAYRALVADSAVVATSAPTGGGWVDDGSVVRLQNSTDKVGIGTTNPTSRLEVNGDIEVRDDNWIGIGSSYERIVFDNSGHDIELMGANVGIGTTNPLRELHVAGTGYTEIMLEKTDATTNKWHIALDANSLDFVETDVDERVTMKDGGNIGIGTTNPTSKLHVVGSSGEPTVKATNNAYQGEGVYAEVSGYNAFAVRGKSTGQLGAAVYGLSENSSAYAGVFISHDYRGMEARAADGEYAGFFTDDIWTTGCTGCGSKYVALNDDGQSLEIGDVVVVSGVAPPVTGTNPIIKVRRSDGGNKTAVIGVVKSRYVFEEKEGSPESETSERFDLEASSIAPGEYLSIVVQGMAQVKVDVSHGAVAPGDLLTASMIGGSARKVLFQGDPNGQSIPDPVIAKALEFKDTGTGLIWAMITLK
jgi:hypothetical protein